MKGKQSPRRDRVRLANGGSRHDWEQAFKLALALYGTDLPPFLHNVAIVARYPRVKYDFVEPVHRITVEIQGAIFGRGKHNTGAGLQRDFRKVNLAVVNGWRPLVFGPHDLTYTEQGARTVQILRGAIFGLEAIGLRREDALEPDPQEVLRFSRR